MTNFRMKFNIRQDVLAERLEIDPSTLYRWERYGTTDINQIRMITTIKEIAVERLELLEEVKKEAVQNIVEQRERG